MALNLPFSCLPQEVLDEVAYFLGTDSFYGPPRSLVPLVVTCRHLCSRLSLCANHHLYARIFHFKFDAAAAEARLGSDRLTSWALADELRRRCIVLKRLRAHTDSTVTALQSNGGGSNMSLRDLLFTAYVLILENEGKNMDQLESYGRIHDWIRDFWFDPNGSSLAVYRIRTGDWPLDRIETALGMWLFWFLLKPGELNGFIRNEHQQTRVEDYQSNKGLAYSESPLGLLKAMAFGANTVWISPCKSDHWFTLMN